MLCGHDLGGSPRDQRRYLGPGGGFADQMQIALGVDDRPQRDPN